MNTGTTTRSDFNSERDILHVLADGARCCSSGGPTDH